VVVRCLSSCLTFLRAPNLPVVGPAGSARPVRGEPAEIYGRRRPQKRKKREKSRAGTHLPAAGLLQGADPSRLQRLPLRVIPVRSGAAAKTGCHLFITLNRAGEDTPVVFTRPNRERTQARPRGRPLLVSAPTRVRESRRTLGSRRIPFLTGPGRAKTGSPLEGRTPATDQVASPVVPAEQGPACIVDPEVGVGRVKSGRGWHQWCWFRRGSLGRSGRRWVSRVGVLNWSRVRHQHQRGFTRGKKLPPWRPRCLG